MALIHMNFFSDALGLNVNADVIIPQKSNSLIGMKTERGETFKTLYLLHGLSDDHTIWQRRTSIERYVADKNLAVVMPTVHRSWYTDMKYGGAYMTYVTKELPAVCRSFFKGMSERREDNFVAGLSMGGYGALKMGLLDPEGFAGIACFSGAIDVYRRAKFCPESSRPYWESIFGDPESIPNSVNSIEYLARRAKEEGKKLPSIYMWCGTEDSLISEARQAKVYLEELGYPLNYSESPGDHSWFYWDREIQKAIDYFMTI